MGTEMEAKCLAEQICRLVDATHGHTLVLFTSYSLMGAAYNQVKGRMALPPGMFLSSASYHRNEVMQVGERAERAARCSAGTTPGEGSFVAINLFQCDGFGTFRYGYSETVAVSCVLARGGKNA